MATEQTTSIVIDNDDSAFIAALHSAVEESNNHLPVGDIQGPNQRAAVANAIAAGGTEV